MKWLITSLLSTILYATSVGQDNIEMKKHLPTKVADQYCAVFKDGKMTLMSDEATVQNDVTLLNGDKVTINCALVKKDGTMRPLKVGECIDKNGNVAGVDKGTGMLPGK